MRMIKGSKQEGLFHLHHSILQSTSDTIAHYLVQKLRHNMSQSKQTTSNHGHEVYRPIRTLCIHDCIRVHMFNSVHYNNQFHVHNINQNTNIEIHDRSR